MRLNVSAKCFARCSRYNGWMRPRRFPARHSDRNMSSETVCNRRRSTIISPSPKPESAERKYQPQMRPARSGPLTSAGLKNF